MDESSEQTQRVFLALWPPAEVQDHAHAVARRFVRRGRLIPARNLHVTLAFLGERGAEDLCRLAAAVDGVRGAPCTLRLDRLGCWRRRGISWLAPEQVPGALSALHASLFGALTGAGFRLARRPFVPHMTVARHSVADRDPRFEPVDWQVAEMQLVRSDLQRLGAVYTRLRSWTLAGLEPAGSAR